MNELKLFENPEFGSIRVIEIDGEPWWVLKDVCTVLDIKNHKDVVARLEDDEKGVAQIDTLGGAQYMTIINESGLYSVILRSDKPKAKSFRRWVTHEVVPTIRKHGAYMTDETLKKALSSPDFLIQLATELKAEQEKNRQLESKIEADKPKTVFADAVCSSKSTILIGDLAKLIKQNGVNIGQKRLFAYLRDNGYLMKSGASYNMPTQYSMERGWFEVKESVVTCPDGHSVTNRTTKVTGRGQQYFVNLFLKEGEEDA